MPPGTTSTKCMRLGKKLVGPSGDADRNLYFDGECRPGVHGTSGFKSRLAQLRARTLATTCRHQSSSGGECRKDYMVSRHLEFRFQVGFDSRWPREAAPQTSFHSCHPFSFSVRDECGWNYMTFEVRGTGFDSRRLQHPLAGP